MGVCIIGCPRSGTLYTSTVIQRHGRDVGHETMGRHGMIWWATPQICPEVFNYFRVLHQVRHPLDCIASMETMHHGSWFLIRRCLPEVDSRYPLRRGAQCWYYWNKMCEKLAEYTYRVEDMTDAIEVLGEFLNVTMWSGILYSTSSTMNARRHPPLTYKQLRRVAGRKLTVDIVHLALCYGYTLEEIER